MTLTEAGRIVRDARRSAIRRGPIWVLAVWLMWFIARDSHPALVVIPSTATVLWLLILVMYFAARRDLHRWQLEEREKYLMGQSNYVHLESCDIITVTEKAVLIEYDGEKHWIPVSQLADGEDHNLEAGDKDITVSITEWIAEQKGIEVES